MRKLLGLLAALLAGTISTHAGTIVGIIRAVPPPRPPEQAGSGAYESRRYKFAEKIDYDHLRDFVIYIDQAVDHPTPAARPRSPRYRRSRPPTAPAS